MRDRMADPGEGPGISSLLQAQDLPRVCLAAAEVAGWGPETYGNTIGTYATTLAGRDDADPTLVSFAENLDVIAACIGEHEPAPSSLAAYVGLVIIENTTALEFHPDNYYTQDMVQSDLAQQAEASTADIVDLAHAALTELRDSTGVEAPPTLARPTRQTVSLESLHTADTIDPVKMYLSEIGSYALLTAAQERALGKRVQAGLAAEAELALLEKVAPQAPRVRELLRTIRDGYDAHHQFTTANLRLVVSIAKPYAFRTEQLSLLELISEGNLGLMRAVDKFDPNKGFKFSTYATWWIRQAITRGIHDHDRTIRTPGYMIDHERIVAGIFRELAQELNRAPTLEEVANKGEFSLTQVKEALQSRRMQPKSLDAPFDTDDSSGSTLYDVVAGERDERQAAALGGLEDAQEVAALMADLDEREQVIVALRFGMIMPGLVNNEIYKAAAGLAVGQGGLSLEEVGKHFDLTRERVRQIQKTAMAKMREAARRAAQD